MIENGATRKRWLAFWGILAVLWITAGVLALIYRDQLTSTAGVIVVTMLVAPLVCVVYFALEALSEVAVQGLFIFAFKVVTLGQIRTQLTSNINSFGWHGFARDSDNRLVASEGPVMVIGLLVYVAIAFAVYWFASG